MRITDIREIAVPLNSTLANSSIDFSEMTTSVVAVITDVMRDGKPVCGFAFNSTGRYACGAQMRARFIPRVLKADPKSLLDEAGGFVAGADDDADGMLLGLVFCRRNIKGQPSEEPQVVHQLYQGDQTKNNKQQFEPGVTLIQFSHKRSMGRRPQLAAGAKVQI